MYNIMRRNIFRGVKNVQNSNGLTLLGSKDAISATINPRFSSTTNGSNGFVPCEKKDGRFISPWAEKEIPILEMIKWKLTNKSNKLTFPMMKGEKSHKALKAVPIQRSKLNVTDKPHVTWIGHATCYFQTEGLNILTDPIFSDTCSPISILGPYRTMPPPEVNLTPDICLLSHTHYDHLDIPSIQSIGNSAKWIVPLGVKKTLREIGVTNCVELNWWDKHTVNTRTGESIDIVLTPTKHWTARTLFDKNTSLWGSFAVIGPKHRFFFSGDTAYCDVFKTIGDRYGPFDMSAISIGAYKPRYFLKNVHCDPTEAIQIHKDLKSKQSFGIHWGTFPLSEEDALEPALELGRARKHNDISVHEFFTLAHFETLYFGDKPLNDFATLRPDMLDVYVDYYEKDALNNKILTPGIENTPVI